MFEIYVREDVPGGDVLIESSHETAEAAEAAAFRAIVHCTSSEMTPVSVTPDGGWSDGTEEGWGGEFIISHDNWSDDYRLVMKTEDW